MERDYNSTRPNILIREYGRNVQNLVEYALSIEDKDKRTKLAYIIVSVMQQVNPTDNANDEYYKKLWNHLYAISDYQLEIDFPFEVEKTNNTITPKVHLEYKENRIKYRFYGVNTELVLTTLAEKPEGPERTQLLLVMANQMKELYINWNKSIVADDLIDQHIQRITDGKLKLPEGTELISSNVILKKLQSNLLSTKTSAKSRKQVGVKPKAKFQKSFKKKR